MNAALFTTVLFAAGIAAGTAVRAFAPIFGIACLSLLVAMLCRGKIISSCASVATVFCAGVCAILCQQCAGAGHIADLGPSAGRVTAVRGWVVEEVKKEEGRATFLFKVEEVIFPASRRSCHGMIFVRCPAIPEQRYGDELLIEGGLLPLRFPERFGNRSDISYRMSVPSSYFIRPTGQNKGGICKKAAIRCREYLRCRLRQSLKPVAASVMEAMVLGEKDAVSPVTYQQMMRTGSVHILVVSGTNVAVVFFIICQLLKILRLPRWPRFCVTALFLVLYCALTGASNPVVRATVMSLVLMLAFQVRREPDIRTACCISLLFILFLDPRQLFDIGFQLSYASVLAIIILYPRLRALCPPLTMRWPARALSQGLLVSCSAWLGTAPLIFYHFRMISPVAVLANLFIVPLAGFLMFSGFSLMLLTSVAPFSAGIFSPAIEAGVAVMIRLNDALYRLPWSYIIVRQ